MHSPSPNRLEKSVGSKSQQPLKHIQKIIQNHSNSSQNKQTASTNAMDYEDEDSDESIENNELKYLMMNRKVYTLNTRNLNKKILKFS